MNTQKASCFIYEEWDEEDEGKNKKNKPKENGLDRDGQTDWNQLLLQLS